MILLRTGLVLLLGSLLYACAGPPPAPVEDRSRGAGAYQTTPDGHYRVRRGDSLYAIAFRYGIDWRDLARWNGIASPYVIHPEQLLRLMPAGATGPATAAGSASSGVSVAAAPPASRATTRPLDAPDPSAAEPQKPAAQKPGSPSPGPQTSTAQTRPVQQPAGATPAAQPPPGSQAPSGSTYKIPAGDPDRWIWPTEGRLLSGFRANDPSRKGIDIGGQAGQPVVASAAGQVVYSGSGLIGYGELIIIKHSDRMLSAYAHNRKRLVTEGQHVTAGGQIAEMGTNDRNQALLHFEIRVNGSPEDPMRYLPKR